MVFNFSQTKFSAIIFGLRVFVQFFVLPVFCIKSVRLSEAYKFRDIVS